MTTTTTTTPVPFTKGSGKKIVAALTQNGWNYHFTEGNYLTRLVATYEVGLKSMFLLTADVTENGSFFDASWTDPTGTRDWSQTLTSLTDVLNACGGPVNYLQWKAEEEAREAAEAVRVATAEAAEAAYLESDEYAADLFTRAVLQRLADQPLPSEIDNRYGPRSFLGDAMNAAYEWMSAQLAREVLVQHGRYSDRLGRCYSIEDATRNVVCIAMTRPDATADTTAVPHAKAVARIIRTVNLPRFY